MNTLLILLAIASVCAVKKNEEKDSESTTEVELAPSPTKRQIISAFPHDSFLHHRNAHLPQVPSGNIRVQGHSYRKPPQGLRRMVVPIVQLALDRQRQLGVPNYQPLGLSPLPQQIGRQNQFIYHPNGGIVGNHPPQQGPGFQPLLNRVPFVLSPSNTFAPRIGHTVGLRRPTTGFIVTPPPSLIPTRRNFHTRTPSLLHRLEPVSHTHQGFLPQSHFELTHQANLPHDSRFLFQNNINSKHPNPPLTSNAPTLSSETDLPHDFPRDSRIPHPAKNPIHKIVPQPVTNDIEYTPRESLDIPKRRRNTSSKRKHNSRNKFSLAIPKDTLDSLNGEKDRSKIKGDQQDKTYSSNSRNRLLPKLITTDLLSTTGKTLRNSRVRRQRINKNRQSLAMSKNNFPSLNDTEKETKVSLINTQKEKNRTQSNKQASAILYDDVGGRFNQVSGMDVLSSAAHALRERLQKTKNLTQIRRGRRKLRKGRRRQRPYTRGPIILMSEVLRNLTSPHTWDKANVIKSHEQIKEADQILQSHPKQEFISFINKTRPKKSTENTKESEHSIIISKDESVSKPRENPNLKDGEKINQLIHRSEILKLNAPDKETSKEDFHRIPETGGRKWPLPLPKKPVLPLIESPFVTDIVSGAPFLVDGHDHLGPFVATPITT